MWNTWRALLYLLLLLASAPSAVPLEAKSGQLCVVVELLKGAGPRDVSVMRRTWGADNQTRVFFVNPRRLPRWQPLGDGLQVQPALQIWRTWSRQLPSSCEWLLKVPSSAYLNLAGLRNRLRCFADIPSLQYLGVPKTLSMGEGEDGISVRVADGAAGLLLRRSLLKKVPGMLNHCARHENFGTPLTMAEDVALGLCLWWHGVELSSWLDSGDETLHDEDEQVIPYPGNQKMENTVYYRLLMQYDTAKLSLLQCQLIITGLRTEELLEVDAMVGKSRRWFKNIACTPGGITFPELTSQLMRMGNSYQREPIFAPTVHAAIQACFLSDAFEAFQRHAHVVQAGKASHYPPLPPPMTPAELSKEWHHPLPGQGPAFERLRKGGHGLCVFVLTTTATEKHRADARAVLKTWAAPEGQRPKGVEVFLVEDNSWHAFNDSSEGTDAEQAVRLTLRGDVDMGFLWNSVRALYLWRYLAVHHATDCDWFAKVDADTFVNTWALKLRLQRYFDANEKHYLGSPKSTNLGSGRSLQFAVNSIVLSSGLLRYARQWFLVCIHDLITRRLGRGAEDMDLAYCFDLHGPQSVAGLGGRQEMPSRGIASVTGGGGGAKLLTLSGLCTMLMHPVHAEDMYEAYAELLRLEALNSSAPGALNASCDWPQKASSEDEKRWHDEVWKNYMTSLYHVNEKHVCWNAQFTWDLCCHARWGPAGNEVCWDDENTWQRCCNRTKSASGTSGPSGDAGDSILNSTDMSKREPVTHASKQQTSQLHANHPTATRQQESSTTSLRVSNTKADNAPTKGAALPEIVALSEMEPPSLGNPKCWVEGGFTYDLCCNKPAEVTADCWVWPFTPLFCCQTPLPPRPPIKVGGRGLPATPGGASAAEVPSARSSRRPRTPRCPGEEAQQGLLACEKSLDEIGALFELSVIGSGDKASGWHDYLGTYERLLLHLPLSANVLELGVRMGSSLAMWSEYFPWGTIVGVDKNLDTFRQKGHRVLKQHGAFTRGNVHVLQANASDISALGVLENAGFGRGFADMVIDDANHWAKDQLARFELYFPSVLKPGGVYIIEDVHIQAPFAHDGTAVRAYFANLSASAYLMETEILVGAHQIQAVRRASQDWRHQVESVTFLRDVVAITKAEEFY